MFKGTANFASPYLRKSNIVCIYLLVGWFGVFLLSVCLYVHISALYNRNVEDSGYTCYKQTYV